MTNIFKNKFFIPQRGESVLLCLFWVIFCVSPAFAQYTGSGKDGSSSSSSSSEQAGADDIDHLTFTTTLPDTYPDTVFSPQPIVSVRDKNDNVVTATAYTVVLSLLNDSGGSATLGGTTSMATSSGVANFTGKLLKVNKPGDMYALKATVTDAYSRVYTGTSNSFRVRQPTINIKWTFDGTYWSVFAQLEADGKIIDLAGTETGTVSIVKSDNSSVPSTCVAAGYSTACTSIALSSCTGGSTDSCKYDDLFLAAADIHETYMTTVTIVYSGITYTGKKELGVAEEVGKEILADTE